MPGTLSMDGQILQVTDANNELIRIDSIVRVLNTQPIPQNNHRVTEIHQLAGGQIAVLTVRGGSFNPAVLSRISF